MRMPAFFLGFIMLALAALSGPVRSEIPAGQKPELVVETRLVSTSVTLDKALKAHPGLADNLLTEGRRALAKWQADAEKEKRETPELFQQGRRWTFERSYVERSVVGRYVSVLRSDGTYQGGAHPNSYADTILWDREAKKRVSIRPFFKEMVDNGPTVTALARLARLAVAMKKIENDPNEKKGPRISPERYLEESEDIRRGIQPMLLKLGPVSLAPSTVPGKSAGLTFDYSPYAVGAYAEGPYTVFVPWTAFRLYLTAEGAAIFGGERPKADADEY